MDGIIIFVLFIMVISACIVSVAIVFDYMLKQASKQTHITAGITIFIVVFGSYTIGSIKIYKSEGVNATRGFINKTTIYLNQYTNIGSGNNFIYGKYTLYTRSMTNEVIEVYDK